MSRTLLVGETHFFFFSIWSIKLIDTWSTQNIFWEFHVASIVDYYATFKNKNNNYWKLLLSQLLPKWEILNPFAIQQYSDAVSDKGAALNNCFGFVDGTVRPICRPGEHQRLVYNGHKRVHALKFQAVALPNGLIGHLFGPVGKSSNSYSLFCFWF